MAACPRNHLNLLNEIGRPIVRAAFFVPALQAKIASLHRNQLVPQRAALISPLR